MQVKELFLGIDTSNYTTSAAVVDSSENLIAESRMMLNVRKGEKGLRQSDALFQHWKNLPEILGPLLKEYKSEIRCVCSGARPRPQDGSYMPVFTAGTGIGKIIAASLNTKYCEISHQEGHLLAAAYGNDISTDEDLILAHLSGGTLEFVKVSNGKHEIIFATKDISYGQLIDRIGVYLGLPFPAGKYVDEMALKGRDKCLKNAIPRIFTDETGMNISGLENSLKNAEKQYDRETLCSFLMERISENFVKCAESLKEKHHIRNVLICGGVASSEYIRDYCLGRGYIFGQKKLCSDNAAGEAIAACRYYYGR